MNWMMARWQELTGRYKKGFLTCIMCVLLVIISTLCTWFATKNLYDQQMAKRWAKDADYAQISCFYPVSMTLSDFDFLSLHHSIKAALEKESITSYSEDAKVFVDAYSVSGKITISTESGEKEVDVVGVSDNFFLFHPLEMLTGAYLDESMLMKDGLILDEEAAFALYGSNDIVGMPVYIGGNPFYIRGVAALEDGYFAKKAGLSSSVCYVPIEVLEKYGEVIGSYTYEVVMPDAVEGFAKNIVTTALNDTEQKIEVVENSSRFSFGAKKEVVLNFGIRSMSRNSILYPYWENISRAVEDVCGALFIVQVVCFVIATTFFLWYVRYIYKNRTWTIKSVGEQMIRRIKK